MDTGTRTTVHPVNRTILAHLIVAQTRATLRPAQYIAACGALLDLIPDQRVVATKCRDCAAFEAREADEREARRVNALRADVHARRDREAAAAAARNERRTAALARLSVVR